MRAGHPLPLAIDAVLASLPRDFVVALDGEARLVAGPAGAFVLLPTPPRGPALAEAAIIVRRLAEHTRGALCDHLAWVPFLDTLLVSSSRFVRRSEVTVAPVDLLAVVLTEGPPMIDRHALDAIRDAVARRRLAGWRLAGAGDDRVDRDETGTGPADDGTGPDDDGRGRINLCDTVTADTTEATISHT